MRSSRQPGQVAQAAVAGGREYLSITEAASVLGVSRVSIWRWIRAGRLPAARLGLRTTRIKRADLERAMHAGGPTVAPEVAEWTEREDSDQSGGRNGGREGERAPRSTPRSTALSAQGNARDTEHFVQFYETDDVLLDAVAEFIASALAAGDAGVVVATSAHLARLEDRLRGAGLDVGAELACGRYVALDAAEALPRFMVDGTPDAGRFLDHFAGVVAAAAAAGRRVHVYGELVAVLAEEGNHAAALRVEELWNELGRSHDFALFCGYPIDQFGGEALAEVLADVCAQHTRVVPAESYASLATPDDRLRAVTALQQKARWLEAEIAERRRAEEQLRLTLESERSARAAAEAALRLRNEFLSIAAHELKTPLTALLGQAQLVLRRLEREGRVDPQRVVQSLHSISGQSKKLSRLLGHLLDVSRLESGKLSLERVPADVAALVGEVVNGARALSDRHTFTLWAPEALAAHVDPLRLEQVVTNLLDNAVKYGPAGGRIEVVLTSVDHDGRAELELSVRDHGLGIAPERRGQIFERFYQAHGNGQYSGMGLGLFISRQIVEMHGGRISVEFPPDGGTRFVVRLPVEPDRADAGAVDTEDANDTNAASSAAALH